MDADDSNSSDSTTGDDPAAPGPDGPAPRSRRWLVPGLAVAAIAALVAVVVWLAGSDEPVETVDADRVPATTDAMAAAGDEAPETGWIDVRLEETGGIFIEGFEVGLRFETVEGATVAAIRWNERFAEVGRRDIHEYYDSVHHQSVPAGSVVVRAEANTGAGPPPSVPDLTGDLPCSVTVDVAPGRTVTVEVSFEGGDGCLRVVDASAPTTTAAPSTTTQVAVTAPSTGPGAATSPGAAPIDLSVGTEHYVDVDLRCRAFELDGVWVLVDGDPSSWQAPGERHEGGTFTVEGTDLGTFVGDAARTKVATFRRPAATEPVACVPLPR